METGNPATFIMRDPDDGHFQVCVKRDRYLGSLGMWVGDNPFDFVVPVTLCQIIVTVIVSRAVCYVLTPLKVPKFICNVLGGILLGPSFMGRNQEFMRTLFPSIQSPVLIMLARLGAVYFVFIIALKMDIVMNLRAAKRCWRFGVIPFLSSYFVMAIFSALCKSHGEVDKSIENLPNVFSLTSFAALSEVLLELNLGTTELGQIAFSSAMVCEIIQWIVLILAFSTTKAFGIQFAYMACCFAFIIFLVFVVRPTMKLIIQRTPMGKPVKESYVVLILLGVLVTSAIGDIIGISFIVGPIVYGLVIPDGPPLATTILERCEVVISELIMPFFFAFIGMNTDVTAITNWRVVMIFQCILLAGFLAKILACVVVALTYNMRPKHGLVLGLMLSIKGIIDLIFFVRMKKSELIDEKLFSQIVLYAALLTAICAPVIKSLYKHRPRVSKAPSIHEGRVRTIQNTSLTSQFNIVSCVHHDANVHTTIALLEACNPSQESPICVHAIHLIELLGKSTPILLPLSTQNKKLLSISYPNTNHIMRAFENYSSNSKGPVTVLSYVNVAPYNLMHEAICNLAEDKLVPFLVIPFHQNDQIHNSHLATSIRDLNIGFQARARCTVGILVDRYMRLGLSSSMFSFHVAILFIGGPDDREALALGIRMLGRVNTRVTLLRFIVQKSKNDVLGVGMDQTLGEQEEEEGMLDDSLVDEFKGKKLNKDNAVFHEVVVDDSMVNVLEAIRGMEMDLYDLVMVGKRHCIGSVTDEEMTDFMDNADQLGVAGDMLASTEFCDGRVSLLVMQCGEKRVKLFDKEGSTHKIIDF